MMWKTASRSHRYCNGKSSSQTPINQGQYQQENVFELDELRICYNCKDTTPIVGKYSQLNHECKGNYSRTQSKTVKRKIDLIILEVYVAFTAGL